MRVEKVMTTEVDYIEVPGSRSDLLTKIKDTGRSGYPVVKKGTRELVGFVSRSSLVEKPDENQIGLLMSRDMVTLKPNSPVWRAAKIFLNEEVRRIPIVENGNQLIGILTVNDLVWKVLGRQEEYQPIKPFIKHRVTCVWQKNPLSVSAEIMRISQKNIVPVLDDEGELVGILREADVLKRGEVIQHQKKTEIASGGESEKWSWDASGVLYISKHSFKFPSDILVQDVMRAQFTTVNEHVSIQDCAKKMQTENLEVIPVMDHSNELCGVIRDIDLLKVLLSEETKEPE